MQASLNASSSTSPRYHQVRLALRQRIRDGIYTGVFPMPGERALAEEFGVGRVTVRSALARLEEEGLVVRLRGKGTVPVRRPEQPNPLTVRGGLLEDLLAMGHRTRVKVLEHKTGAAPGYVAQALGIEPGARVLKVVRVRSFKGHPFSLTEVHVPHAFAHGVTRRELGEAPMLAVLERRGVKVVSAEQTMGAAVAEPLAARCLGVPEGMALLKVVRTAMDQAGRPVQFLVGLFHPERYEYRMRLSRVGGETKVWVESDQNNRPASTGP
jgi:GntR family transcriptional regulator